MLALARYVLDAFISYLICRYFAHVPSGSRFQCKWLHKVILSDKESQKSWQQKSYRGFAPDITFEGDLADWPPPRLDQAPIVQEMPVQSLVCNPPQNSLLGMKGATDITVKGVAWSGGGRKVERVDVSIDGGKTWTAAELYKPIEQRRNRHWAWTQFSKTLPLPEHVRKRLEKGEQVSLDITSKAMNSDFNVQVCSVVSSYSSGLGLQRPVPYSQSTNYVVSLTP
jgi:sulfite oxidase